MVPFLQQSKLISKNNVFCGKQCNQVQNTRLSTQFSCREVIYYQKHKKTIAKKWCKIHEAIACIFNAREETFVKIAKKGDNKL